MRTHAMKPCRLLDHRRGEECVVGAGGDERRYAHRIAHPEVLRPCELEQRALRFALHAHEIPRNVRLRTARGEEPVADACDVRSAIEAELHRVEPEIKP